MMGLLNTRVTFYMINSSRFYKSILTLLLIKHSISSIVNFISIPSRFNRKYTPALYRSNKQLDKSRN